MKTFSPYQIAWIILKSTKGVALKSDSEKTHFGRTLGMLVMHYPTQDKAKELCRLRLGTTLQENNITVIKVPFIGLWLVW